MADMMNVRRMTGGGERGRDARANFGSRGGQGLRRASLVAVRPSRRPITEVSSCLEVAAEAGGCESPRPHLPPPLARASARPRPRPPYVGSSRRRGELGRGAAVIAMLFLLLTAPDATAQQPQARDTAAVIALDTVNVSVLRRPGDRKSVV